MGQTKVLQFISHLLIWISVGLCTIRASEFLSPSKSPSPSPSPLPLPIDCVGALYFTTNNILENWVVVNCIQPDGTLLFNNTISTRGNGSSHVNQYLFVNYVITGDNFLFVANSGSDSVSMFTINPQSPEKLTFVTSVNSQGNFPVCLAYSSTLKVLCVLNVGAINNVACFKVTPTDLYFYPNTVKPVGKSQLYRPRDEDSPSDIKFSADSNNLIVSVRGAAPNVPAVLAVFHVSNHGSVLSDPVLNAIEAFYPVELTLISETITSCNSINQQPMIYTSSNPTGLGLFTVPSSGIIDPGLMVNKSIPWNIRAGWSKFSPRTGLLYTTDDAQILLTETKIECTNEGKISATVLKQYPLSEKQTEFLLVNIPCGEFLYSMISRRGGSRPIIQVFELSSNPTNVRLIQSYGPDSEMIRAQTGQSLHVFSQGIAFFIAQPQGGAGGQDPLCTSGHRPRWMSDWDRKLALLWAFGLP